MKKILIYLLLLSTALVSCKKENALNVDLTKSNPQTYVPGETDEWLTKTFLDTYNMEVIYRFDRFLAPIDKELIPIREDQIKPVMETVMAIWIEPYLEIAGKDFLKPIIPKQVALVGSAQFNNDGTITLGTADAGRRINLFQVNDFDKSNLASVEQMLHTIHHEFVHILHQKNDVPPAFENLSPQHVGNSWNARDNSQEDAMKFGFITRYARMNKDEDFAETASTLLVEGQAYFNGYANSSPGDGGEILRKKEQMVVDYYKSIYGIDFRALQEKVRLAKIKVTGVEETFGAEFAMGAHQGFVINKSATLQSAAFVTAFNAASTAFRGKIGGPMDATFTLEFADLSQNNEDMILKITGGGYNFWYNLILTDEGDDYYSFEMSTPGRSVEYENGDFVVDELAPLLDYLAGANVYFKATWVDGFIPNSKGKLAGFEDEDGALAFYGTLK